jgi:hypothetical protein
MLRFLQGSDFGFNAEQQRDKVLQMRRNGDQQRRFVAAVERRPVGACRDQPFRQPGIGGAQEREERRIDASKPRGRVQVGKSQSESELQHRGVMRHAPAALRHRPAAGLGKCDILPGRRWRDRLLGAYA